MMRKGGSKETRKADEEEEEEPSLMRPLKRLAANVLDRAVDKVETAMGIDGDEDAPPVMEQLRRMGTGLVEFQKTPEGKKATQEVADALSAQVEVLKKPLEKTKDVVNQLAKEEVAQAEQLGRDVAVDLAGPVASIPLTVFDVLKTVKHAASASNKVSAVMDEDADPVTKAYNRVAESLSAFKRSMISYIDGPERAKRATKDVDNDVAKEDKDADKEDKDADKDADDEKKEKPAHATRTRRGGHRAYNRLAHQRRVTRRRHANIVASLRAFQMPGEVA